jgi:hypothetical protein
MKPNPLVSLYHFTVAWTVGPEGLSNCGPRGGAYPKLRAEARSSHPRNCGGGLDENLCLCWSRRFPRGTRISAQSRPRNGDRLRTPPAERVVKENEADAEAADLERRLRNERGSSAGWAGLRFRRCSNFEAALHERASFPKSLALRPVGGAHRLRWRSGFLEGVQ